MLNEKYLNVFTRNFANKCVNPALPVIQLLIHDIDNERQGIPLLIYDKTNPEIPSFWHVPKSVLCATNRILHYRQIR